MKLKGSVLSAIIVAAVAILMVTPTVLASGAAEGEGEEEPIVWKFPIAAAPGEPYYDLTEKHFKDVVEERTDGRLQIEMFSETEIGTGPEIVTGLRTGAVEMHQQAFAITSTFVPDFKVLSLPFVVESRDHLERFMETSEGQGLLEAAEEHGVYAFETGVIGFRFPVAANKLLDDVSDFEGFDMRTMENQLQIDTMRALGANPNVIAYGEVYTSIDRGVVQGYFNDRTSFEYLSINEVAPYYTELPLFASGTTWIVSKQDFDALPQELQTIVREVIHEAAPIVQEASWERNVAGGDEWKKDMFEDYVSMEEVDLEPFVEAVQPVYEEFLNENPDLRKYVEALDRVR